MAILTKRAQYGWDAVRAGTPDLLTNVSDPAINVVDTLANIMHYANEIGLGRSLDGLLDRARSHYEDERADRVRSRCRCVNVAHHR